MKPEMDGFLHRKICSKATKAFFPVSYCSTVFVFFFFLFCGASLYSRRIDAHFSLSKSGDRSPWNWIQDQPSGKGPSPKPRKPALTLPCPAQADPANVTCASGRSTLSSPPLNPFPPTQTALSSPTCPDYFRWIHEDLRPWAATGIAEETLERSKIYASFRLIIVDGRAYAHHYRHVFQTRDAFTIWGILQLLRRYPGRVPDLDLMFDCEDMPVVPAAISPNSPPPPPPLFRYCKDDSTVDIVFPDWSFWGWPEVNIKSWAAMADEIREGSERRRRWSEREPYAYWKGNPTVSEARVDLMKCNLTEDMDWKARIFKVNWGNEERQGFPTSNLANQCSYRYKVYVEGKAWSVSEKYILGCDSPTLYVESKFQDFVSRGLRPGRHYWPISREKKCWAIMQAVNWGNKHTKEVEDIGKAGSKFINEELKMKYVYDYMLHLLTEYSKLLTYKPTKPEGAIELCLESVACPFRGKVRDYLLESMEMEPSSTEPCSLPPPFRAEELTELLEEKKINGASRVVETLMKKKSAGRRVGFVPVLWSFLLLIILFICFA